MIEEWRSIEGYEGLYEVSNTGRVRSVDRYVVDSLGHRKFYKGKVLIPVKSNLGYLLVSLCCNGKHKMFLVHRLVAQVFIENPDNLPEVNHLDEDKTNNRVDNLEFCDRSYNINYGLRNIRVKETAIKNGYWSSLSRKEYRKKYYEDNKNKLRDRQRRWYQENRDRICERQKEYYRKKKEQIQNNA